MQVHDFVLVAEFLRQLEEEAILEGSILRALLGLSLRFFVLSQCIKTGRFEKVDLRVKVVPLDQFIVYIHRSPTDQSKRSPNVVNARHSYG